MLVANGLCELMMMMTFLDNIEVVVYLQLVNTQWGQSPTTIEVISEGNHLAEVFVADIFVIVRSCYW